MRELDTRYAQASAQLTFFGGASLDHEDRNALADLKRGQRAEIEALLTPQQLEELDLRESAAARYVLSKLPPAQSEADFRAMVRAAQEVGIQADPGMPASGLAGRYGILTGTAEERQKDYEVMELRRQRDEAQLKAIESRVKGLLGEQHFAELQQAEAARQATQRAP